MTKSALVYDEDVDAWLAKNADLISSVKKKLPAIRAVWLDNFLMSIFADLAWADDHINFIFNLMRKLQVELNLRDVDFTLLNQDKTRPLVTRLADKSEEVLPGSFSMSSKHMRFKLDVFHEIERRHKVVLNDHGHPGDNGYGHDVSRLLSLTGVVPAKIGVRPISNRQLRLDNGLSNTMPPDLIAMGKDFLDLLFGCVQAKSIRIEGKSQSGLPCRQYGKGYKTIAFVHAARNIGDISKHSNDLTYLMMKYDILHVFLQGSRRSPDAGGKVRYITTESDNALGLAGATKQDNTVRIDGVSSSITKHFATMRYRFVWGGNAVANSIVNVIGTSARDCYGQVYGFTFKHKGRSDLADKLRQFCGISSHRAVTTSDCDMYVLDVSSFDQSYPKDLLRLYVDLFKDSELGTFFTRTAFAPSIQGTLDKDAKADEPVSNGNPLDFNPEHYMDSGLPSGWSFVSDAGKMMACAIYYCLVKAQLLEEHSVQQLDAFLKGKLNYGLWNLGDDNVILGPANSFDLIKKALDDYCPWKTEPEPGARFIGFPICVDEFGQYSFRHDPASYVTNMLTPERGIKSAFRKYWAIGLQAREHVYADTSLMSSFKKIIGECWKRHYNSNLDAIIEKAAEEQRKQLEEAGETDDKLIQVLHQRLGSAPDLNYAQAILSDILRDHSVLAWKYSSDDIKEAFGIDKSLLESRPHVWTSETVLEKFGYNAEEAKAISFDNYNGRIFSRKGLDENIKSLIINNFKEAKICL